MSSRVKKRRDRLARKAIAKKISVAEAQRRAGGKYARKAAQADLAKSQQARADLLAKSMRQAGDALRSAQPLTEDDLRAAAIAPMPRPAVTAAPGAGQARRRDPQRDAMLLKSYRSPLTEVPVAVPQHWTGIQQELLHQAEYGDDPFAREAARQALVNEGMLPGKRQEPVTRTVRGIAWAPGPDGTFGWQPMAEPRPLDFGIAVPGTAGR